MLVGQHPFHDEDVIIMRDDMEVKVRFPRDIPRDVRALVRSMLNVNPKSRPRLSTIRKHPWMSRTIEVGRHDWSPAVSLQSGTWFTFTFRKIVAWKSIFMPGTKYDISIHEDDIFHEWNFLGQNFHFHELKYHFHKWKYHFVNKSVIFMHGNFENIFFMHETIWTRILSPWVVLSRKQSMEKALDHFFSWGLPKGATIA